MYDFEISDSSEKSKLNSKDYEVEKSTLPSQTNPKYKKVTEQQQQQHQNVNEIKSRMMSKQNIIVFL